MDAFGIPMAMMVTLDLPDDTPVVYTEEGVDKNTIGAVRTKNWSALFRGFKNAQGSIDLVWCPNNDPDYHAFYVPNYPGVRPPEKVYAYPLFSTSYKDSVYRRPKTLGEYKMGAALIMAVEKILDSKHSSSEEWQRFQALLQPALREVTEWGEYQPHE